MGELKSINVLRDENVISQLIFGNWEEFLEQRCSPEKVVIITDEILFSIYKSKLSKYRTIVIPCGEAFKVFETINIIVSKLLEMQCDRGVTLIGFGGGVVTDITGFSASVFMRGVKFSFISTSLLGQVDASVGGKNGVNSGGYKNVIGTFNQPEFVLCDTEILSSLSTREFISGFAEIIKIALIFDIGLVGILESTTPSELRVNKALLEKIIITCIQWKAKIVSIDERENGLRRTLNFGHTLAHAVEKATKQYSHGEAVSLGIVYASELSVKLGFITQLQFNRVCLLLERYELPIKYNGCLKDVLIGIANDKKRDGDVINFVLLKDIGECCVERIELTKFV